MVGRVEKGRRYERWAFYLPSGPRLQKWKRCLREVVEAGRVGVQIVEVSASRIDLIWPRPVTWDSAWRLTRLAGDRDSTFRILGDPQGIVGEPAAAESAKDEPMAPEPAKKRKG